MTASSLGSKTFALDVRVLQCRTCGAPLAAPVGGGQVQCEYCGAVAKVAPRPDLHAALAAPAAAAGAGVEQRLFALHQQAASYDGASNPYAFYRAPPGLEALVGKILSKGEKDPEVIRLVPAELTKAIAACEASPGDPLAQRRCYWLALMAGQVWAINDEFLRERAALEAASEVLTDPGHRYVIRTDLAKAARNMGDLASADAWLAQCDPNPWILDLDSAYRVTAASLALLRGQWDRALDLLGRMTGQIPFDPSRRLAALLGRAAAFEGSGQGAAAEATLIEAVKADGRKDVEAILEGNDSVAAAKPAWARLLARGAVPKGPVKVGRYIVKGCSIAGILGIVLPIVVVVLCIVFMPLLASSCGACFGYHEPAMAALRACPAAAEALGPNIRVAATGLSCGNAETSGATGHASWTLPVRGDRASGTYQFTATKMGGPWTIQMGTLTVEGRTIDVANCSATPPFGFPMGAPMPIAPMPPTPAPPPVAVPAGGACARMAACCSVAGSNPTVSALCGSLPQVQSTPMGETVCQRYLESARQALSATGAPPPPQCQ